MKKYIVVVFLCGFFSTLLEARELYHWVRVEIPNPLAWFRLQEAGIALEEGTYFRDRSVELVASDSEIDRMRKRGLSVSIQKPDLERYFALRLQKSAVDEFATGSMGGNFTYQETMVKVQGYRNRYRQIVSQIRKLGTSLEGRTIVAFRISDNPDKDEPDEPEVLFTALHHAREPQSLMTVLYFVEQLLEGYRKKDPEITYLINNRQIWVIPVVNPDGYVYNQQTNPGGGGMWRKNRRNNGNGTYGVDLNRNYSYQWGYDNLGSSPDGSSEIYRGTAPFSEPETRVVRDFVVSRKFLAAMNYHSFRNVLIYPWSYSGLPAHRFLGLLANLLTLENTYPHGTSWMTLKYNANGEADDWLYGDRTSGKTAIFAYTPEVGGIFDNFWPPRERILPLARMNYRANIQLVWMPAGNPTPWETLWKELSGNGDRQIQRGEKAQLQLLIRNYGLKTVSSIKTQLLSKHPSITVETSNYDFGTLGPFRQKKATRAAIVRIHPSAPLNKPLPLELRIYSGDVLLKKKTLQVSVAEN